MQTDIAELTLDEIQSRILAGETLTADQYRRVIERYRGERRAASATSTKSRKRAPAADFDLNASLDDLFSNLEKKGS
jgi:hypothetical protein